MTDPAPSPAFAPETPLPWRRTRGRAVDLAYLDVGRGEPVVFVHEFAGDAASWLPQISALARRNRCIAFNARGYAPSDIPLEAEAYSFSAAVEDITGILDHLGLDAAHLVGLSMGGYAVLCAAMRYPQRCKSIVVSSAGSGSVPSERAAFVQESLALASRIEEVGIAQAAREYATAPSRLPFREKDPIGFERFFAQFSRHDPAGSALTLRGVQAGRPSLWDFADQLKACRVPALLVVGDRDRACIEPTLFVWRHLPAARLAVLPNTGHCANLEEPETFNRFLSDFWSTQA